MHLIQNRILAKDMMGKMWWSRICAKFVCLRLLRSTRSLGYGGTMLLIRCPMKEKKYTKECADGVVKSLGTFCICFCFAMFCGKLQYLY